jgi:hypothetical protein
MTTLTEEQVALRVCRLLGTLPGFLWVEPDSGGVYPRDTPDVAVFAGPIGATPDRAVGVWVYARDVDLGNGLTTARVQLRTRGRPSDVFDAGRIADTVHDLLHGLTRTGGINSAVRPDGATALLGLDGEQRLERTDTYHLTVTEA